MSDNINVSIWTGDLCEDVVECVINIDFYAYNDGIGAYPYGERIEVDHGTDNIELDEWRLVKVKFDSGDVTKATPEITKAINDCLKSKNVRDYIEGKIWEYLKPSPDCD